MRIVIDTNVVVSALFFGGNPKSVIDLLMNNKIEVFVSKEIIEEYKATIEFLKNKYSEKNLTLPINHIISQCNIIEVTSKFKLSRDSDDDKFINCAIDSNSLYIVSGDKDLLSLNTSEGVEIITAKEFLNRYHR